MNQTLVEFERRMARKPVEAAKVLGMSYSSYAGYRGSDKPLPDYLALHVDTLMKIDVREMHEIVCMRLTVRGNNGA